MTNAMIKRNGNAAASFDNVFDNFFGSSLRRFFDGNFWETDKSMTSGIVPVNVREREGHYEMDVIAPGCKKEDFSVTLQDKLLTISYAKKEESTSGDAGQGWTRNEFVQASFKRSFSLDDTVEASGIKANYTDGILRLEIPKSQKASEKNRTIEIL